MTKLQKRMCTTFALLALVILISACSGSPTGPSNTGNGGTPTPTTGSVTINFKQTTVTNCQAKGTVFCNPTTQLGNKIQVTISWFDPTIGATGGTVTHDSDYVAMTDDGSASVTMGGIPKGRITITVFNSWLCASGNCGSEAQTGRGITVNGVQLIDGSSQSGFTFTPPTAVTP